MRGYSTTSGSNNRHWKGGITRHPLYTVWKGMKSRCLNPHAHNYHRYGARGIIICDRWLADFWAFVGDIGERPSPTHTLERCDNDGNYEPNNVRWATRLEQAQNRDESNHVRGERQHCAVLDDSLVYMMLEDHMIGASAYTLAGLYGVSSNVAWQILSGQSWRHVQRPSGYCYRPGRGIRPALALQAICKAHKENQ